MASRVRVAGDLYHGRVPDGAVYVGRQAPGLARSLWANPHRAGQCRADGCREAGASHRRDELASLFHAQYVADHAYRAAVRDQLAGRDLACWCKPGDDCHADVLLEWANGEQS